MRAARRPRTPSARPVSPYGIAKLAAEEYVAGWNRIHGTGHVVLRFANVYGPRQSAALEGGVVSIFMERLARGEETLVFGDGEQTRDFVYVGDVVAAVLAAAEAASGGIFNVGTGVETTVNELHRLCARDGGVDAEPRHVAAARAMRAAASSTSRAPSASSAGGRRSRSTTGCARTWESSLAEKERGARGRNKAAVEHSASPGRLAVAHGDARRVRGRRVELVILLVLGVALLAKPVSST